MAKQDLSEDLIEDNQDLTEDNQDLTDDNQDLLDLLADIDNAVVLPCDLSDRVADFLGGDDTDDIDD